MGNAVHKFQFADHNRTLEEIKFYYDKVLSSLEYRYSKNRNVEYDIIFSGMTEEEVEIELEHLKEELSIEGAFPYQRGKHNFDAVWIMVNAVETVIGTQFYRYEPIGEKSN